jgi:NifB/MoaA-like Fe-S oxidoreductase
MKDLTKKICKKVEGLTINVVAVKNNFFGRNVTVSGLVAGCDIVDTFKSMEFDECNSLLLIPQNMLKSGEDIFLDDMTLDDLKNILNVDIITIPVNGAEFVKICVNPC